MLKPYFAATSFLSPLYTAVTVICIYNRITICSYNVNMHYSYCIYCLNTSLCVWTTWHKRGISITMGRGVANSCTLSEKSNYKSIEIHEIFIEIVQKICFEMLKYWDSRTQFRSLRGRLATPCHGLKTCAVFFMHTSIKGLYYAFWPVVLISKLKPHFWFMHFISDH